MTEGYQAGLTATGQTGQQLGYYQSCYTCNSCGQLVQHGCTHVCYYYPTAGSVGIGTFYPWDGNIVSELKAIRELMEKLMNKYDKYTGAMVG